MYKIINANESHAEQILEYLTKTCYWKEFVEGNLSNQSYSDFMLNWVVLPRIPVTKILIDENNTNKVLGCLICAPIEFFAQMPDYAPHLNHKVMEIFDPWFSYPVSNSFILELYAIDKELRKQGWGNKFIQLAEEEAKLYNKKIISAFVWNCSVSSLITLMKQDYLILDSIKFNSPITPVLFYLEKNINNLQMVDYFETEQYLSLKNLLLSHD